MSTEVIVVNTPSQELEKSMEAYFAPFEEQAKVWLEKAKEMKVTDASQTELMEESRKARLAIRAIRIQSEEKRVELKEESLRRGQLIDKIAKRLKQAYEPVEAQLQANEDFVKIQEENRKKELAKTRLDELLPYMGAEVYKIQLAELDETVYQNILSGQKLAKEARDKVAADAAQKVIDDQAELARLKEENKDLKETVEEKEEHVTALKQAVATGDPFGTTITKTTDKALLKAWGVFITKLATPEVKSDHAKKVVKGVQTLLGKINDYIVKNNA
jgi:ribosomal protein L9